MKGLLLAILIASPAMAADGFGTLKEFQPDLDKAVQCHPIDGRQVWKGEKAYYIQSCAFYTCGSGALSSDSADAIIPKNQSKKFMTAFVKACK